MCPYCREPDHQGECQPQWVVQPVPIPPINWEGWKIVKTRRKLTRKRVHGGRTIPMPVELKTYVRV